MRVDDFNFELPEKLIAQSPIPKGRDQSRLMVLERTKKTIADHHFFDLVHFLEEGDLLVFNNSKVIPARLFGIKEQSGGKIELLLLHQKENTPGEVWECMVRSRRTKKGQKIRFERDALSAHIQGKATEETWFIEFHIAGPKFRALLDQLGHIPIPPYIKKSPLSETELRAQYQTVYATEEGSVAAPTAGLHFTHRLLDQLKNNGVQTTEVTLHVGLGTFAPVRVHDVANHRMHSEYAIITQEAADLMNQTRAIGKRIISVGTTTLRTLESFVENSTILPGQKWTDIFITPGHTITSADGLITNFHLPRSTLLMLVSALGGQDFILKSYQHAIEQEYRFYSFGDAMLIL